VADPTRHSSQHRQAVASRPFSQITNSFTTGDNDDSRSPTGTRNLTA